MHNPRQIDCEALGQLAEHHPVEVAVILEMLAAIDEPCADVPPEVEDRLDKFA
jgi:hypothetical protein